MMRPRYCRSADSRMRMQNALLLLRGMLNCLMASVKEHWLLTKMSRTAWYLSCIPCKLELVTNSEIERQKSDISLHGYLTSSFFLSERLCLLWSIILIVIYIHLIFVLFLMQIACEVYHLYNQERNKCGADHV